MMQVQPEGENPHGHYFKNVRNLAEIDVYRVIRLFGVTDPALAHAVKKLLVAGGRGAGKSQEQDVKEAIISCKRFLEMNVEDVTDAGTGAVTVTNIVQVPNCSSAELARRISMKDLEAIANGPRYLKRCSKKLYDGKHKRKCLPSSRKNLRSAARAGKLYAIPRRFSDVASPGCTT